MTPFWHAYLLGGVCFVVGVFGLWKSPQYSGLRTISNCLFSGGIGILMLTAFLQLLR